MCVILKRSFLLISVKYGRCISLITRIQNGVHKCTLEIIAKLNNGRMGGRTCPRNPVFAWVLKIILKQSHTGIREKAEYWWENQFKPVLLCHLLLKLLFFSYKIIEVLLWYFELHTHSLLSLKPADFRQNWFFNCTKMLFPRNFQIPGLKLTCEDDIFNKMKNLNFLKFLYFGLTSASWSDDVQETAEFLIRGKLKIKI